ncbi:SGNH/GDSL hydrolase family protein [Malacoplasma muris]|uniref:SGNH/GDSL hydrolase family protein n=1 Tax=Malacoplasma muris TaxID=2119 RepID=UPI00398F724F
MKKLKLTLLFLLQALIVGASTAFIALFITSNKNNNNYIQSPEDEKPVTSIDADFKKLLLGNDIVTNMQKLEIFANNFGFFGGSDFSYDEFSLYEHNGFRTLSSLFDDYARSWAPYNFGNSSEHNKYVYGKRVMFDFTKQNNSIKDILLDFDNQTINNNILSVVYQLDTVDIKSNDENEYSIYLKELIDKSLSLRNNTGMIIIKDYYYTNNIEFNNLSNKYTQVIKKTILDNYKNDQNKLNRIQFVNHGYLTTKKMLSIDGNFIDYGIDKNNKLTINGQFELFAQFLSVVYPNCTSYNQHFSPTNFDQYTINHEYSNLNTNNYLQPIVDQNKVNNFQAYLKTLQKANWSFVGDSISYAGVHTKGFNGYTEYFRWLIRNEYNRKNDFSFNQAINGNRLEWEIKYKDYNFSQYNTDILSVMLGTNDVTSHYNESDQFFIDLTKTSLNTLYNQYKSKNPNGWLVLNTITYRYNNEHQDIMNQKRDVMNQEIKNFAQAHNDVLLNDTCQTINYFIKTSLNNDTSSSSLSIIYSRDSWHFNTTGNLIIAKSLLHSLGFSMTSNLESF